MSDLHYTDSEVVPAINNATIAVARWDRVQAGLAKRPHRLRALAQALVQNAQEACQDPETGEQAFTPAELVAGLQIAAGIILMGPDILPEESLARRTYISRTLVSGKKKLKLVLAEEPMDRPQLDPQKSPVMPALNVVTPILLPPPINLEPIPIVYAERQRRVN